MAEKKKVKDIVSDELEGFLGGSDMELYNVEFVKEGKNWFLRVFIDKKDADSFVGTDDCEKVSRFLSDRLDEIDPIKENYYLEVSSPGMDRTLIKDSDFTKFSGKPVEVSLYKPEDGRKNIEGILIGLENDEVVVEDCENRVWRFSKKQIAKVKLAVVF